MDDLFDEELQNIGVKFTDATCEAEPVIERTSQSKVVEKPKRGQGAGHEPIPKYAPSFLDRLKGCAKWALTFGCLTMVFFYWQEAGLMDPVAAVPSMCVCTGLAGFGVGKHALKK